MLKQTKEDIIMKVIATDKAPAAIGPYSQGLEHGNMVFVSGQIPVDPATGKIAIGSINDLPTRCRTSKTLLFFKFSSLLSIKLC